MYMYVWYVGMYLYTCIIPQLLICSNGVHWLALNTVVVEHSGAKGSTGIPGAVDTSSGVPRGAGYDTLLGVIRLLLNRSLTKSSGSHCFSFLQPLATTQSLRYEVLVRSLSVASVILGSAVWKWNMLHVPVSNLRQGFCYG